MDGPGCRGEDVFLLWRLLGLLLAFRIRVLVRLVVENRFLIRDLMLQAVDLEPLGVFKWVDFPC